MSPAPAPHQKRRRGLVLSLVAVALIPLVLLGVVLLQANRSSSVGAADPQGAVINLAKAIDNQDVLAALTTIAPEESAAATNLVKTVIEKAHREGLIADQKRPLAGVTSSITGLQLSAHQLHPLVARVDVTAGTMSYSFDPAKLTGTLRNDLGSLQHASGSVSVEKAQNVIDNYNRDHDHHLSGVFMMTVKRNGRWFVSPFYTVAEYLRQSGGLPSPDYDATTRAVPTGADSPEDVVRNLLSISINDPTKALALLPPDALRVVYDYMGDIKAAIDRYTGDKVEGSGRPQFELKVNDLRLSSQPAGTDANQVNIDGLNATATITATIPLQPCNNQADLSAGATGFCAQAGSRRPRTATFTSSVTFSLTGTCWTVRATASSSVSGVPRPQPHGTSGCLSKVAPGLKLDRFFVMTVHERGGWYVDPLGTVANYLRLVVQQATPADMECFLRMTHDTDRQQNATKAACARSTMFTH